MKKSLTIEDLKSRIGKPIFVIALKNDYKKKNGWYVLAKINEFKAENKDCGYIEFTDCNCINFKNAEDFRLFDTEVSEEELKEILESEEKSKKKTGYERVRKGEKYWNTRGGTFLDDDDFFNTLYLFGDYINNENLAKNIARAEGLRYQLRRFAALNGGIPSVEDWDDDGNWKYFIMYDYKKLITYMSVNSKYKIFGQVYFKSEEACKKALEIFKDELLWYFTEFKEMLY